MYKDFAILITILFLVAFLFLSPLGIFVIILTVLLFTFLTFISIFIFQEKIFNKAVIIPIFILSFLISLQLHPTADKAIDNILTYEAIAIKIDFDKELSKEDINTNLQVINNHFKGREYTYGAVTAYTRQGDKAILADAETRPYYWKWVDHSLHIYLSTRLTNIEVTALNDQFNEHFFNRRGYPKSVLVAAIEKPLYLRYLLDKLTMIYDENIEISPNFIAHGLTEFGDEQKMTCTVTFKIKNDYWKALFEDEGNHKKIVGNIPMKISIGLNKNATEKEVREKFYQHLSQLSFHVKLNGQSHHASVIYVSEKSQYYLTLSLEPYTSMDKLLKEKKLLQFLGIKPLSLPAYSHSYLEENCLIEKIKAFPYLKKLIYDNNFLPNFKGNPTKISFKNKLFSPLYNDVNIIKSEKTNEP